MVGREQISVVNSTQLRRPQLSPLAHLLTGESLTLVIKGRKKENKHLFRK